MQLRFSKLEFAMSTVGKLDFGGENGQHKR